MADDSTIKFEKGDVVVYPSHGIGEIVGQVNQTIGLDSVDLYVINFRKNRMTVSIPVANAVKVGLRHINTNEYADRVMSILCGKAGRGKGSWSKRAAVYENKIHSGDLLLLSEVVRDLHDDVNEMSCSYSENVMYENAVTRIAEEIASIKSIKTEEARDVIMHVLTKGKSGKIEAS